MIYLDTSVVVALLTPEERSPQALNWFEQCSEPLFSSDWLITETHSALSLKQRQHSRCTQLASFDIRMQQASRALGLLPALN